MSTASASLSCPLPARRSLINRLNAEWHKPALLVYTVIVLAHWSEHLAQAAQIYLLGWPVPESRGFLGLAFPWLVSSELLHYAYAFIMLVAFWILRKGFTGRSYIWWMIAFWIQFWHHIEHALLQGQALLHHNLFNSPVPNEHCAARDSARGVAPVLQHDRYGPYGDRDVLPHVPHPRGGGDPALRLCLAPAPRGAGLPGTDRRLVLGSV